MPSITVPLIKSISVNSESLKTSLNSDIIRLGIKRGVEHISFLYFDLSCIPDDISIKSATLVLVRTDKICINNKSCFYFSPLIEYFSNSTTYQNQPTTDYFIENKICICKDNPIVCVDLTNIVCLWAKSKFENKGIKLFCKNDCYFEFASENSKTKSFIPFIRINYIPTNMCKCKTLYSFDVAKNFSCKCNFKSSTIRQVKISGIIEPDSIFNAIAEIKVKRKTGIINSYYVADEYNNLQNTKPLKISKTYNIAIIPKINKEDQESLNFYGSYKSSF